MIVDLDNYAGSGKPGDCGQSPIHPAPFGIILDQHHPRAFLQFEVGFGRIGLLIELALHVSLKCLRSCIQAFEPGLVDTVGIGIVGRQDNMGFRGFDSRSRADQSAQHGLVIWRDPSGAQRAQQGEEARFGLPKHMFEGQQGEFGIFEGRCVEEIASAIALTQDRRFLARDNRRQLVQVARQDHAHAAKGPFGGAV